MVYRGRPSKACFACRGRRIKCDLNSLGCGQCTRMKIPCPGYPDPLEQGYRDQSELVMKKAEASYRKKARRKAKTNSDSSSTSCSTPSTTSEQSDLELVHGAIGVTPSLPLDTIAVAEFVGSYAPQSPYNYLPDVLLREEPDSSLAIIVQAVSIAMVACKLKDRNILNIARKHYSRALHNTNIALRDPKSARVDSTLVSVLLLGLFEALQSQLMETSSNWLTHTKGALALLQARGEQQFASQLGRQLFGQVSSILTFDAMLRRAPIADGLLQLVSIAKRLHFESPKTGFVQLIAEITRPPFTLWDNDILPDVKVSRALLLDQKVLEFTEKLPADYEFRAMPREMFDELNSNWEVYGHNLHQYQHHHAARMWNATRVLRILINGVIARTLNQYPSAFSFTSNERRSLMIRTTKNMNGAAADICATVPQMLSPDRYDQRRMELPDEARVATLLSALATVKAESLVPQTARRYAADRLKCLAKKFNVPQAEAAATSGKGLDVLHSGYHMLYVY